MPIYVFRCKQCGAVVELEQRMNDDHTSPLCQCGCQMIRDYSIPTTHFVGDGFTKSWESLDAEDIWKDNCGQQEYVE